MQPDISLIVPVYNVEKYLRECLASIVAQTRKNIEIILIDDRGQDDSMKIAREFVKEDKRIKIITHETNAGLSAARNTGITNSAAPFVMFVDSDDLVAPQFCEKMLNAIESSGADLAMCGTNFIYETDRHFEDSDAGYYKIRFNGLQPMNDNVLLNSDCSVWNKIYRRDILKKHNVTFPEGLRYEDSYFFNAYACWARTIFFVKDKLYTYRRRAGSIMNETFGGKMRYSIDHLKVAIKFYEYLKKHDLFQKRSYYMGYFFISSLMFGLWHEPTKRGQADIYKLANDFIRRECWNASMFPPDLSRKFQMLANQTLLGETRRRLGGLVKVSENTDKKKVYFLEIPVWKVKYAKNMEKHYLFGLNFFRLFRKNLTRRIFNGKNFTPFAIDSAELLGRLRELGHFAYIPNPGNMGDMLIASATMQFFDNNGLPWTQMHDLDSPPETIVYGGGGIWTARYEGHWEKFLPVFARARRVVILPSSFNNCQKLIDAMDERFVVFCRERKSYDYLASMNGKAKLFLDHDMAFRMQKGVLDCLPPIHDGERDVLNRVVKGMKGIGAIAKFMREDCESAGKYKTDFDLSYASYGDFNAPRGYIDFNAQLMLCAVDSVDAVITDRLHVGIAGALMGKEVHLLDNSGGKISSVYTHTMRGNPQVRFTDQVPCDVAPKRTATNNLERLEKSAGDFFGRH